MHFEINFYFSISKNLCQFAKMFPEHIDSFHLLIWTDFTQGTDTGRTQTFWKYPSISPSAPTHKTKERKGGRGIFEENFTF